MKRQLEAVDILVAIGMVATLLGGYLVFKASYGGALAVTTPSHLATSPPLKLMIRSMLQPAMGQAIVDHATLERQFAADLTRGAGKLYQATLAARQKPMGGLHTIEARAAQFQADHDSQVQYVMGKTIVNLTRQGIRAGVLSADNLSNKFNDRIIATSQALGNRMEEQFAKNWQPRLGEWIVEAAQRERRFTGHVQERIGKETVTLASIQERYLAKRADLQNQFQALTSASARTDAQTDLFARLTNSEMNLQRALGIPLMPEMGIVQARTLPEIPFGYMVAAFAALVVIFLAGFALPRERAEPENLVERIEKVRKEIYLKAV